MGGFPCQDYSVAKTLSKSKGIVGKKGVLWWEIHRILKDVKSRPEFVLLENVDRLLSSPATQRGRDFAIILASLSDLGYIVEWRIINAAEYGMPQRRRRVFIMGYHKNSHNYGNLSHYGSDANKIEELLNEKNEYSELLHPEHPIRKGEIIWAIRNEMAILEREGLIVQPHTSAGRIPTNQAYRLFVNQMQLNTQLMTLK